MATTSGLETRDEDIVRGIVLVEGVCEPAERWKEVRENGHETRLKERFPISCYYADVRKKCPLVLYPLVGERFGKQPRSALSGTVAT